MKKILIPVLMLSLLIVSGCDRKPKKAALEPVITEIVTMTPVDYDRIKAENKGKVLVLNFFASWCPPCKQEMPALLSVYSEFKDKNFVIIGVSIDDSDQEAIDFVNEFGITYPVYRADKSLRRKYNVSKVPTSFIYAPDGILSGIVEGMLTEVYLKRIAQSAE